jgi:hypothetical protein
LSHSLHNSTLPSKTGFLEKPPVLIFRFPTCHDKYSCLLRWLFTSKSSHWPYGVNFYTPVLGSDGRYQATCELTRFVKDGGNLSACETVARHNPEAHDFNCSLCSQTAECNKQTNKETLWPESSSELYRPSDRRSSEKLVLTFADRECNVISVTDPYVRILGFIDRSRHFSIK